MDNTVKKNLHITYRFQTECRQADPIDRGYPIKQLKAHYNRVKQFKQSDLLDTSTETKKKQHPLS